MSILSQRECAVLTLLLDGKSDGDIAPILGISPKTVGFHVENAKRKLGASHRARAVALALRDGLIAFPPVSNRRDSDPSGSMGAIAVPVSAINRPFAAVARQPDLVARVVARRACATDRTEAVLTA